jgi:hypothetical protein
MVCGGVVGPKGNFDNQIAKADSTAKKLRAVSSSVQISLPETFYLQAFPSPEALRS